MYTVTYLVVWYCIRMKTVAYGELVKQRLDTKYCPFCEEWQSNYIDQNESAYVISARAPYESDHVLICPKSHCSSMTELGAQELQDIRSLITKRNQILYQKHAELVIFVREGSTWGVTGKTVWHLHRHIVPHLTIHCRGTQQDSDARVFMDNAQYQQTVTHLQSYL